MKSMTRTKLEVMNRVAGQPTKIPDEAGPFRPRVSRAACCVTSAPTIRKRDVTGQRAGATPISTSSSVTATRPTNPEDTMVVTWKAQPSTPTGNLHTRPVEMEHRWLHLGQGAVGLGRLTRGLTPTTPQRDNINPCAKADLPHQGVTRTRCGMITDRHSRTTRARLPTGAGQDVVGLKLQREANKADGPHEAQARITALRQVPVSLHPGPFGNDWVPGRTWRNLPSHGTTCKTVQQKCSKQHGQGNQRPFSEHSLAPL
jgi:hypothetical protein